LEYDKSLSGKVFSLTQIDKLKERCTPNVLEVLK
jgi:hypothetical protein